MRFDKKILICLCIAGVMLTGCSSSSTTSKTPYVEPETEGFPTIFDKKIAGITVNEEESVYDITEAIQLEDYTLIGGAGYDKEYFVAVYTGESDTRIVQYSLASAKEYKTITISDHVFEGSNPLCVTEDGVFYLYDEDGYTLYLLNLDKENYEQVVLTKEPQSMLVVEGGSRIIYTIEEDTNIYQFLKDSESTQLLFETEDVYELRLEYLAKDYDTIVTHVVMSDYTGYASISIEEQSFNIEEDAKDYEVYYTGDAYIYIPEGSETEIYIYNELMPRLQQIFSVDEAEELENLQVYGDGPYIVSQIEDEDNTVLRLYDVTQGIKSNQVEISKDYTISKVEFLKASLNIYIETVDEDGNYHFLIWDTENVSEVIS